MFFKNLDYAAGWLAGIIDGEGCVSNPNRYRRVAISNTDMGIVRAIEEALTMFGISYYLYHRGPRCNRHLPFSTIIIENRDGIEKLLNVTSFASEKKAEYLKGAHQYHLDRRAMVLAEEARRDALKPRIIELHKAAVGGAEIKKRLKCSLHFIQQVIKESGINVSHLDKTNRAHIAKGAKSVDREAAIRDYQSGDSISEVARRQQVYPSRIKAVLLKAGVFVSVPQSETVRKSWKSRDRLKASEKKTQWHKDNKEKFREAANQAWVTRRLKAAVPATDRN